MPQRGQESRETRTTSQASIEWKPETQGLDSKHGEAMKTLFEVKRFEKIRTPHFHAWEHAFRVACNAEERSHDPPLRGQEARVTRTTSQASMEWKPETQGVNSKHGEAMKILFEIIQFQSSYRKPNDYVNAVSVRAQMNKILLRKSS